MDRCLKIVEDHCRIHDVKFLIKSENWHENHMRLTVHMKHNHAIDVWVAAVWSLASFYSPKRGKKKKSKKQLDHLYMNSNARSHMLHVGESAFVTRFSKGNWGVWEGAIQNAVSYPFVCSFSIMCAIPANIFWRITAWSCKYRSSISSIHCRCFPTFTTTYVATTVGQWTNKTCSSQVPSGSGIQVIETMNEQQAFFSSDKKKNSTKPPSAWKRKTSI